MKKITPSSEVYDPAVPAKKAARKTAAPKAAPPVDDTPAEISKPARKAAAKKAPAKVDDTPAGAVKPARKTAAKKAAGKADEPAPESAPPARKTAAKQGDDAPPAPAPPARKSPAKKAASRKTPMEQPELPIVPPGDGFAGESSPPRKTPAKKAAAKKSGKTAPSAEPAAGDSVREEAPTSPGHPSAPPPGHDYHPDQNRFSGPAARSDDRSRPAPSDPSAEPPGYRPSPYPPRQPRPYPPRDAADAPPSQAASYPPQGPPPYPTQGPGPQQMELGPDGQPRRLTKWERWKLRKEKFKQQKQQRYLERTGRLPQQPGPNGEPPPMEGETGERREPRPDPRGEPRPWEPRPPRPEVPLGPPEDCEGLLEMTDKGFAFLRPKDRGFVPSPTDPFVSAELVRQHALREGVWVEAIMQRGGRGPQVMQLKKVNGLEPSAYRTLPLFEELTAINPNKRYILETEAKRHTTRLIDFISPIGRGQRGLIVAPPRAGKTTFLQHIAEAVLHNYEDVKVIVLLVDERPEEVTEIARALPGAEVMASSNDQDPRNHIRMANLAVERAKRLVEAGQHVFMLLDSITRLARGFNNAMRGGGSGKAMSGGLDSRALEAPRRLFAAARNTREAGSLTIMATALVETNNKGDDLIFQEFKGTGNMELVLDRKISQAYVYPAVDIFKSGTRREELLLPAHQLEKVHLIRRGLSGHRPQEAVERLLQVMGKYNNNNQMLIEIKARGE